MAGDLNQMTYQEFRQRYEEQHPASVPKEEKVISDNPGWMVWATLAMFICAAALSGVHTVPTAYATIEASKVDNGVRQIVALGTFVFVELGILIASYTMFKRWSWIAFIILALSISIAIVANLYSVFEAMQTSDLGAVIVGISLGIGAPVIAMLAGKQFVNLHRAEQIAAMRAKQQYNDACLKHDETIQAAWQALQAKLEAKAEREAERERIRIERESEPIHSFHSLNSLNGGANERPRLPYSANSSTGYTKQMNARDVIREFFEQNPDAVNSRLDDLVERIIQQTGVTVGRTSVHNVRKEFKQTVNVNEEVDA